jgi:hypothetical protein
MYCLMAKDELGTTSHQETLEKLRGHFAAVSRTLPLRVSADWKALEKLVPFLDLRNRERLMEAFGGQVGWVLVEDQYIDRDYRDTFSHIFSRRFATPPARSQRLHFFDRTLSLKPDTEHLGSIEKDSYLGYAVIRPTRPNGLGRVMLSPRISDSAGTGMEASLCEERITLFGHVFLLRGFPFIGQDIDVSTCAQATIWMLRRYYSNRYRQYGETLPYELSQLAARHLHGDRSFPATGLSDWQMAEILRGLGFSPMIYSKKRFPRFNEWLLSYLDSGIPLILCFDRPGESESGEGNRAAESPGHAVACFGFRDRSPVGSPKFRDHAIWPGSYQANNVLINDDNYPPYLEVGTREAPARYPTAPGFNHISSFIVPLQERISLLVEQFDSQVRGIIGIGPWSIESRSPVLAKLHAAGALNLRVFLTTCRNLKQKLAQPNKLVETAYRLMPLPHFVWVCEFHDHRQPWESRCMGEILWDATCNKLEPQGLLALHYPETLAINLAPVFENRVLPEVGGWTEIPLQAEDSPPYSPASVNLDKF